METLRFCITDYGAFESDTILQTEAIQHAIDVCFQRGGGIVSIPFGIYLTGGLRLRSNVTLYLKSGAILLGSRNPEDYFGYLEDKVEPLTETDIVEFPTVSSAQARNLMVEQGRETDYYDAYYRKTGRRWNNALIRAVHAENVSIIGEPGAVIDGANCFDALGEEEYRGPHAITMYDCKNVLFQGYTMKNSSNWGHNIIRSTNIVCRDISIYGGHDGVHFTECQNVDVSDCEFFTGDDCVAGFANINMTVSNCKLNSSCSGFRIGGTNVFIQGCHIWGPSMYAHRYHLTQEEKMSGLSTAGPEKENYRKNMISAVTYYADMSFPIKEKPGNIIVKNCVIENTDRFLHYNYSGNETWQKNRPLGDITFENIKATGLKLPINAYGDEEEPLTLMLKNVSISDSMEFTSEALIHACYFEKIILENIKLESVPCTTLVKRWSTEGQIVLQNIESDMSEETYITDAKEEFFSETV